MIYEKVKLSYNCPEAELTSFVTMGDELNMTPRRAVIVCPGGGYRFRSEREAEPIVYQFMAEGFAAFLLDYSVKPDASNYTPLIQASLAIKYVRENAARFNIDPEQIYITGFSAGGHLAASAGVLWNHPRVREAVGVESGEAPEGINRPTGMILSYPVITAGEKRHNGSIVNVSGSEVITPEVVAEWSLELHVDETTPQTFIWSTVTDKTVPVENTLLFVNALQAHGVPYEVHIFPTGHHGMSLCTEFTRSGKDANILPHNAVWMPLAIAWLRDRD